MNINPIKTMADYHLARKRIAEIIDFPAGSTERDEAHILGLMVDDYEKNHDPIDVYDPRDRMEEYDMTDLKDEELEFMILHSGRFGVLEDAVDFQTQKEYVKYSDSFDRGELTEEQTIGLGDFLQKEEVAVEGKKKALTLLAHLGTITALRQIEKFYHTADTELKQWSALALQECKAFLESALTDEMSGFISGGLGGSDNRLRYYFLVLPLEDQMFSPTQKRVIQEEMNLVARKFHTIIESCDPSDMYVAFTALVPMDVALATLIEAGISQCNELGEFVFEYYYVGNTHIPNEAEIREIIQIIWSD